MTKLKMIFYKYFMVTFWEWAYEKLFYSFQPIGNNHHSGVGILWLVPPIDTRRSRVYRIDTGGGDTINYSKPDNGRRNHWRTRRAISDKKAKNWRRYTVKGKNKYIKKQGDRYENMRWQWSFGQWLYFGIIINQKSWLKLIFNRLFF